MERNKSDGETNTVWFHSYMESKKEKAHVHKRKTEQKNLIGSENRLAVTRRGGG